jgi:hypothetical protein
MNSLVEDRGGSTPLIQKLTTAHDPDPVPHNVEILYIPSHSSPKLLNRFRFVFMSALKVMGTILRFYVFPYAMSQYNHV